MSAAKNIIKSAEKNLSQITDGDYVQGAQTGCTSLFRDRVPLQGEIELL